MFGRLGGAGASLLRGLVRGFAMSSTQQKNKPEVLFVLGGPGSGKGTVCAKIVDTYGYVHLSAGDLLRAERQKLGSEFGELIESHIVNGTIVPVEITCSLLERGMQLSESPHNKFLIDGFPRNRDNVEGWEKAMSEKVILKGVIFLECSQEICTQRCLNRGAGGSGRSDDNVESLVKRHQTYVNDSMPIVTEYEKRNLVHKFNGMKSADQVFADVQEFLKSIGW